MGGVVGLGAALGCDYLCEVIPEASRHGSTVIIRCRAISASPRSHSPSQSKRNGLLAPLRPRATNVIQKCCSPCMFEGKLSGVTLVAYELSVCMR